jgi:ribonuclease inhibitor
MSVKKYVVNGKSIQSLGDFYDEITKLLSLPEYFGRNLDALADVLTTDIEGPFEISWEFSSVSKKALKRDYSKIVSLLKRVAKEREDFKVIFQ